MIESCGKNWHMDFIVSFGAVLAQMLTIFNLYISEIKLSGFLCV